MHFLPDVYVQCDVCKGKRYNRETLEIAFKDKSIADILDLTVDEGVEFFKAVPTIRNKLETLQKVGLGYIKLGQPATTLSGGDAQRVKLSKELSRRDTGRTLYIPDESTTRLHFHAIEHLHPVLPTTRDASYPIVVGEHTPGQITTVNQVGETRHKGTTKTKHDPDRK